MKIVDYLIIVSTWLLSSYTFSSSDVEFRKLDKEGEHYKVEFGIVAKTNSSRSELESVLLTLDNHEVLSVNQIGSDFVIVSKINDLPDFERIRKAFNAKGFELDPTFLKFKSKELRKIVNDSVSKIKNK